MLARHSEWRLLARGEGGSSDESGTRERRWSAVREVDRRGDGFDAGRGRATPAADGLGVVRAKAASPMLVLTFRRVPVQEETLQYVRHCYRRVESDLAMRFALVDVLIERSGAGSVRASISLGAPPILRVEDEDPDEFLAIRNAFARLHPAGR
jgi:hypothetical protein